jgi:predicted MPP superfamily phosphohydrolase
MRFFTIFLSILFSVSFGIHYFVVRRLSRIFEFQYTWKVFLVFLLITANFLAVILLSRLVWNVGMHIWWVATVSYIGTLWILFSVLLLYSVVQLFAHFIAPIPPRVSQYVVVGITIVLVLYSLFNARQMTVNTVELSSEKLQEPITIVQLTDLHLGAVNGKRFVEKVVAQTNALNPAIVAITGDLVDIGTSAEILQGFNKLDAPAFFVWGNHEQFLSAERVEQLFRTTPITILKNETIIYKDMLQIIGLDYLERQPQNDARPILTSLAPKDGYFTLMLSHAPIDFPQMDGHPIDLQLAGHTHAGQLFPWNFVVKWRYAQTQGLYKSENRSIYVSSGTGTWGPPMRLGTSNEMTVIRLLPLPPDTEEQLLVRQVGQE